MATPAQPEDTRRTRQLTIALLIVAAIAPFVRTLLFGYVMDEVTAIRSNTDLNGWASLIRVWSREYGSPDAPFEGLYRPLTMSLFAVIRNAGQGWPLWFHLLAIVLHVISTLLVWRVLKDGVSRVAALIGALVFAVHPVHVEAVANVANASEILVGIWSLLLALHLARSRREGGWGWQAAAVSGVLFFLALTSKESGAVAPVLALAVAWGWRRDGDSVPAGGPVVDRATVVAWIVALLCVIALRWAVLGGPLSGGDIGAPGIDGIPAMRRVWSMLSLGPLIGQLLLWPTTINPGYGPSAFQGALSLRATMTVVTLLLAFAAAIALARRGDRRWLVALVWITVAFIPASNLLVPTGQILAERTLYGSSIGVAMLVALAAQAIERHGMMRQRLVRTAAILAVAVVIVAAGIRTYKWTGVWSTHERVYRQMVAADADNYRGYWSLAMFEGNNGRMPEAVRLLERAYALYPSDPGLRYDYADALFRSGRPADAARIAEGYLASPVYRRRPSAVGLYALSLRLAFGADSLLAAGARMRAAGHPAMAALLEGQGLEVRGDAIRALEKYRDGLRNAPDDALLLSQVARLTATR